MYKSKRSYFTGMRLFFSKLPTVQVVTLGYISYVVIGWILLSLPISETKIVSSLDNLFIATSAMSTTGLATISISDNFTFLGQLIILLLIQLGGIGYMTFGSFIVLSTKKSLSDERLEISNTVFSLPGRFRIDTFIKSVISFSFFIELFGAISLYFIFSSNGVQQPVWNAIFHSISAFCTAGFSLFNDSFEGFRDNVWLNLVIGILSYLGALGFIVCVDFWRKVNGKSNSLTLTSKVILNATLWFSFIGTINIFLTEPSIQGMAPQHRLLSAFFQTMTAITTVGFNTIPISSITRATMLLITLWMIVGASPSGTGGGLKTTTFSAMWGVLRSALRAGRGVKFWGNEIPLERVWMATATASFYLLVLSIGIYLLTLTESATFEEIVFEATSALGTVGLSMGITSSLTILGKLLVTILMFVGRLGPLTFGIAIFTKKRMFLQDSDTDIAI